MNGFGALPLPSAICVQAPAGSDGLIGVQNVVGFALFGEFVAVLDQQPVGALAAVAVMAHPHQYPTAMQLVAIQREFQVALLEALFRIVGFPITAVPKLHGAAAILAFGNGAFEIAVVERMILDLDRQPLVVGIQRWAFGDRPGLEHAVEFQPEIIMQSGRIVLLDHEAALFRRFYGDVAAGFGGLVEITLFPVGRESFQGHDRTRYA